MGNSAKCVCGVCGAEHYFPSDALVAVWTTVVLDPNHDLEGSSKPKNHMTKLNKLCNFEGSTEHVDGFVVFHAFWSKLDHGLW